MTSEVLVVYDTLKMMRGEDEYDSPTSSPPLSQFPTSPTRLMEGLNSSFSASQQHQPRVSSSSSSMMRSQLVNPQTTPSWVVTKDSDPMMQALYVEVIFPY
jgi:hypothetical protein